MSDSDLNLPKQPPAPSAPEPPDHEDSGTQALSEALRSSFYIIQIIMVILVIVFLGSGFFTVKEQNKAIILRMGRPVGQGQEVLLLPGPHFAFPRPIDEVTNIPNTAVQQAVSSSGWYKAAGEPEPYPSPSIDPATSVSYVLTADTNILHVRSTVTYRVTRPITFYFEFSDAAGFITNDLNNALLYAASRFTVDDILSLQPTAYRDAVDARLRDLVERQGLGISVDTLTFEARVPLAVSNDFAKVVQAGTDRNTTLSQARTYESTILGSARGESEARIKAAEAETVRRVEILRADETNFSGYLSYYQRNPNMVKSQLQAEIFKSVWSSTNQSSFFVPQMPGGWLRIDLGEQLAPLTTTSTNQPGQ